MNPIFIGAKVTVDRSKRINISVSDEVFQALDDWADQQVRPVANLASFLIERSIAQAKESGEYKPRQDSAAQTANDRALNFLKNVVLGREQNILDVQRLADELGVPSDRLAKIIVQNGAAKKNVKSSNG